MDIGLILLAISAVLFEVIVIVSWWCTMTPRTSADGPENDARREEQERREGEALTIWVFEKQKRRHELDNKHEEQRKQDAEMIRELARKTASLGQAEERDADKAPLLPQDQKNEML
ncbi:hypothetical protein BDP55DRAFT_731698 [Colletotrichum godetiae]|uniref:Uncharacterized protein n=1 Tax=Colletotrichum godetiae TaxID=1209918 RepID=A0AAJ0AEU4_9PEZI|nr:uncharacterized protein BDP55DRAFT_731698 [Colletotrichum godetiae]KAK1672005.1 hypothetical protein BDP55DRAFT_731698 [Colletotrichum godetiae]